MQGATQMISGIPIFEDKNMREGTYIAIDEYGMPIKAKDIATTRIAKIVVRSIESFKRAIDNNQEGT